MNTKQSQSDAWQAAKDLYDTLPESMRADITREAWEGTMPWVLVTACDKLRAGMSAQDALHAAFADNRAFLLELAEGKTDRAKAARQYCFEETYKALRA